MTQNALPSAELLDALALPTAVLDLQGVCRHANAALRQQLGLSLEPIVGRGLAELRGPAAMARLQGMLPDLRAGRPARWEGWTADLAGTLRYLEETVRPFTNHDGETLLCLSERDLSTEQTRLVELQAQLDAARRAEHLKAVIVDKALVALVSTDDGGHVVEFNAAAEAMFRCTRAEALGRPVQDIMIPPEHREAHHRGMQRMREGQAPRMLGKRLEMNAQRPDGSQLPVEMVVWRTDIHGHPHYTASINDLTERRQQAELIERQRDALRHAERLGAMGSMLAGVAHELNNPLAIVMGRASLLEDKAAGTALAEDVRRIREAAERCGRIVRTFLDMARSRPSERRAVVLNEVIDGAMDLLRYGLRTHGIVLELALDPDLPEVDANADQVGQVVLNLIVNAQQALADHPEPRRLRVSTGVDGQGGPGACVWLRVEDNGPGVPASRRADIFEPFFTTKPTGQGLGLGLALSRGLAREHGGDLQLEQGEGGSCFRLSLPLQAVPLPREPAVSAPPVLQAEEVDAARLLVVDDEVEIAELLRRFLEGAGYEVAVAESGAVALELLEEARFDAVISDLRMPDLDGAALWRAIGERWPTLRHRLLFVTGDTLSAGAAEFFAASGCPTLLKPFAKAELLAAVQGLLQPQG